MMGSSAVAPYVRLADVVEDATMLQTDVAVAPSCHSLTFVDDAAMLQTHVVVALPCCPRTL